MRHKRLLKLAFFMVLPFIATLCMQSSAMAQDISDQLLEISLADIVRGNSKGAIVSDPLFDFYAPPLKSKDRFRAYKRGLLIEQFDNSKSKTPSWDAGFRTLVLMKGDFKVDLDLDCTIEEPSSGWGQGIYIAVAFDDSLATEYRLCRYAVPDQGQIVQVEVAGPRIEEPSYIVSPTDFQSGKLTIERIDGLVNFFVDDGKNIQKIAELTSPGDAHVRYIEVRCTRQNEGNTKARYLFKTLRIETDSFFGFEADNGGNFPWFYVILSLQLLALLVFSFFAIRRS